MKTLTPLHTAIHLAIQQRTFELLEDASHIQSLSDGLMIQAAHELKALHKGQKPGPVTEDTINNLLEVRPGNQYNLEIDARVVNAITAEKAWIAAESIILLRQLPGWCLKRSTFRKIWQRNLNRLVEHQLQGGGKLSLESDLAILKACILEDRHRLSLEVSTLAPEQAQRQIEDGTLAHQIAMHLINTISHAPAREIEMLIQDPGLMLIGYQGINNNPSAITKALGNLGSRKEQPVIESYRIGQSKLDALNKLAHQTETPTMQEIIAILSSNQLCEASRPGRTELYQLHQRMIIADTFRANTCNKVPAWLSIGAGNFPPPPDRVKQEKLEIDETVQRILEFLSGISNERNINWLTQEIEGEPEQIYRHIWEISKQYKHLLQVSNTVANIRDLIKQQVDQSYSLRDVCDRIHTLYNISCSRNGNKLLSTHGYISLSIPEVYNMLEMKAWREDGLQWQLARSGKEIAAHINVDYYHNTWEDLIKGHTLMLTGSAGGRSQGSILISIDQEKKILTIFQGSARKHLKERFQAEVFIWMNRMIHYLNEHDLPWQIHDSRTQGITSKTAEACINELNKLGIHPSQEMTFNASGSEEESDYLDW